MADNVTSNAGSGGPTWATDEIAGVHYPRMKIVHGADGAAVDASPAAPLPTVDAAMATAQAAMNTKLDSIAASVDGLEGAAATTNGALAAIAGSVDGLETAAASTNTKLDTLAGHVDGLEAATGAQADAAAAADGTGNYSLISAAKRALLNWAALLARVPVQVTPGLLPVDTLGAVGVARQLAAGAASANTALTASCRRISICATSANIRFSIGTGAQTASATSHFIQSGERLDLDVPASAQIAVIRAGSTDGVLELSELV